ncbi:MAG: hypothetical protein ABW042_05390, partial [Phenylobacterium sp.]
MADRAQTGRICASGWLPALLALLAILAQAAMPGAAMAARSAGSQTLEICTGGVAKVVTVDPDGRPIAPPLAGLHCAGCLAAASAVLLPPTLT